jgi:hypothetical protein
MNFADWLHLREAEEQQVIEPQVQPPEPKFPDANEVAYVACVLHQASQRELLYAVDQWAMGMPRLGWIGRGHHMTVIPPGKVKQANLAGLPWGEEVNLEVVNWAKDQFGVAVVVKPSKAVPFVEIKIPHITVAHSNMVGPVYSNTLLAEDDKWDVVRADLNLKSYFVAVMKNNQSVVWPAMGSLLLASPTFTLGPG